MPKSVQNDHDSQFTSNFQYELRNLIGRKVILSIAFYPEMDGQIECTNKMVMYCIRSILKEQKGDWVLALLDVELAINSTINDSMEFSPIFNSIQGKDQNF